MKKKPVSHLVSNMLSTAQPMPAPSELDLAIAAHQAGKLADAERHYRAVLAADPRHLTALSNLGTLYVSVGALTPGMQLLAISLDIDARQPHALNSLGNALQAQHRFADALRCFNDAIALRPDMAEAHANRAHALYELRQPEAALASCDEAIRLQPEFAQAWNHRAIALQGLGRFEEALASTEKALALQPGFADAWISGATTLEALGQHDAALTRVERALSLAPQSADALVNRGHILQSTGRYTEAMRDYKQALAFNPQHPGANWNRALLLLLQGDYVAGWAAYEWRWADHGVAQAWMSMPQPRWLGEGEIAGKTLLLHAEQGLGDTIQFCRYIPQLEARGARVLVAAPPTLAALLRTVSPAVTVLEPGTALPEFDLHCPMGSLPLACRTTLDTIPAAMPYLQADPALHATWRARLGPRSKQRIGLVWSGGEGHRQDKQRSMAFAQLVPLLAVDAEFHVLQQVVRAGDEAALQLSGVIRHEGELTTLAETAALVAEMDLIISVDTSVAHLAGALGVPTWILLAYAPDFRWMLERSDTPWYPTARLFRQRMRGDWGGVVEAVQEQLASLDG